jgi:hypothetical protein
MFLMNDYSANMSSIFDFIKFSLVINQNRRLDNPAVL